MLPPRCLFRPPHLVAHPLPAPPPTLLRCLVRILRHLSSGLKSRRARQGGTSLTFIIYDRYFSRPTRVARTGHKVALGTLGDRRSIDT